MTQTIPDPRDGAAPVASAPTRPRPWPSTRRILLPIVAAAVLAVGSAGPAFACVLPPQPPPCHPGTPCGPHHPPKPPIIPPTAPATLPPMPTTPAPPTTPVPPTSIPAPPTTPVPSTSTPAPLTPTEGTCTQTPGGGDTCHVVTGSPSFTG